MQFWGAIKELSTRNIRSEADRRFYLGLAGTEDQVRRAERVMFGVDVTEAQLKAGREFLELRTAPFNQEDLDRLSLCQLVVALPGGPALVQVRPAPVAMVSHPHDLIPTLLEARPDWRIALARHFPAFREPVADRLIADISRINAEFAMLSTLPSSIPAIAPLLPATAGTNVLMLTKNQVLLICRLAAVYGLEIDPRQRVAEITPIVGGAFGWRAAARGLAGFLPGAAGWVINGSIAYVGTYVVGKAAQQYYRDGVRPGNERMRLLYEEARERARSVVQGAIDRVRRLPNRDSDAITGLPPSAVERDEAEVIEEVAVIEEPETVEEPEIIEEPAVIGEEPESERPV